MNVYDFDGTVIDGDSEIYFIDYVFNNYSKISKYKTQSYKYYYDLGAKHTTPEIALPIMYEFTKEFKSEELDDVLNAFWDAHEKYLKKYFLNQKKSDDILTSATPRFILEPIAKRLNVNLIASNLNLKEIKLEGLYNFNINKVTNFNRLYPDAIIDDFYSDSLSDLPMAKIAKRAYFVKGDEITKWETK